MEMMVKKKKDLIPKLRFKQFTSNWEIKSGSDLFDSSRTKGHENLPIYSVTLDRGMIARESVERVLSNDANAEENLFVAKNDISYNMMRMWQGAYGLSPVDCMVSPAYVVLRPKENTDPDFFIKQFGKKRSLYLFTAFSYGITSDRLRLYFKDFAKIKFIVPQYREQQKIASFLAAVDQKIRRLTHKKELLEQYKKGVMSELCLYKRRFSNSGKLRKGKIKDFGYFYYGKSAPKFSVTQNAPTPCVRYGELYSTYKSTIKKIVSYTDINPQNLRFSKGGEVLVPRVGEDPLEFANCRYLPLKGVAIGEMISVYNTKEDGLFITYYFNSILKEKFARVVEGGNVSNLYFKYLEDIEITVPLIEEQRKIAMFISTIEDKIENTENQITKVQTFKKGLLQQMFL